MKVIKWGEIFLLECEIKRKNISMWKNYNQNSELWFYYISAILPTSKCTFLMQKLNLYLVLLDWLIHSVTSVLISHLRQSCKSSLFLLPFLPSMSLKFGPWLEHTPHQRWLNKSSSWWWLNFLIHKLIHDVCFCEPCYLKFVSRYVCVLSKFLCLPSLFLKKIFVRDIWKIDHSLKSGMI